MPKKKPKTKIQYDCLGLAGWVDKPCNEKCGCEHIVMTRRVSVDRPSGEGALWDEEGWHEG